MKFLDFVLLSWVIVALLDPDPKPWLQIQPYSFVFVLLPHFILVYSPEVLGGLFDAWRADN